MHGLPAGCHVCLSVKESKTYSLMDQDHIWQPKVAHPSTTFSKGGHHLAAKTKGVLDRTTLHIIII